MKPKGDFTPQREINCVRYLGGAVPMAVQLNALPDLVVPKREARAHYRFCAARDCFADLRDRQKQSRSEARSHNRARLLQAVIRMLYRSTCSGQQRAFVLPSRLRSTYLSSFCGQRCSPSWFTTSVGMEECEDDVIQQHNLFAVQGLMSLLIRAIYKMRAKNSFVISRISAISYPSAGTYAITKASVL